MKELVALCLVIGGAFWFFSSQGVRVVEKPVERIVEKPVVVEKEVIVERPEPPKSPIVARVRPPQSHPHSIDRDGHHLVKVEDRGRVALYQCTRCYRMMKHTLED